MKNYRFILDNVAFYSDRSTEFEKDDSKLYLVSPSVEWKDQILEYRKEFLLNNDNMDGTAGLDNLESIDKWLVRNKKNESISTVENGFVPAALFLAIRRYDGKLIGMIHIRKELNEYLEKYGGHIGYSVRKSERNRGYAKKILKMGLYYCKNNNISEVLLTCDRDNIFSEKVIISNRGVFKDSVIDSEGKEICRYCINLQ